MHATVPRFDWSWRFGDIVAALSPIVAVAGAIWWASEKMANFEYRLQTVERHAVTYIPLIESTAKSDNIQNNRMDNFADAMRDVRTNMAADNRAMREQMAEMGKNIATLREGMAGANAKLENVQQTLRK